MLMVENSTGSSQVMSTRLLLKEEKTLICSTRDMPNPLYRLKVWKDVNLFHMNPVDRVGAVLDLFDLRGNDADLAKI
jgi:hypothetical protein